MLIKSKPIKRIHISIIFWLCVAYIALNAINMASEKYIISSKYSESKNLYAMCINDYLLGKDITKDCEMWIELYLENLIDNPLKNKCKDLEIFYLLKWKKGSNKLHTKLRYSVEKEISFLNEYKHNNIEESEKVEIIRSLTKLKIYLHLLLVRYYDGYDLPLENYIVNTYKFKFTSAYFNEYDSDRLYMLLDELELKLDGDVNLSNHYQSEDLIEEIYNCLNIINQVEFNYQLKKEILKNYQIEVKNLINCL